MHEETEGSLLTATWRNVAAINFVVPPDLLSGYLPDGLELSPYEQETLLSVVGFQFQNTRMGPIPVPFYGRFIEIYLGFFAQRQVAGEIRRGWVFIKKIVPSRMVAFAGRVLYNEEYIQRPMREQLTASGPSGPKVRFEWQNNDRWNYMALEATSAEGRHAVPGSIEDYVTNNYGGYSRKRDGSTIEFPVSHPQWTTWSCDAAEYSCDIGEIYGAEFVEPLSSSPHSAFIASGSKVSLGKASDV